MPSGNRVLEFKIWAANMVRRGAMAAKAELSGLKRTADRLTAVGRGLGKVWGSVRTTFIKVAAGVALAAGALAVTLKKAFTFERYTVQFKILFRDMAKAQAHLKDLQDFAARTPFQIGGIVEASRSLYVFTESVMGGVESLRMVGDAAAAVGQDLSSVAMWVGRAYSMIKAGRPFGEAAMRLQEMGVLSAKGRNAMEDLQKSGGSAADVFAILTGDLRKFEGGMAEASRTGEGLVSTLKDNLGLALADFGNVFVEDAKGALIRMIEWLQKLRSDGSIEAWATKAREALSLAAEVAKAIAGGGEGRTKALGALGDILIGALRMGAQKAAEILVKASGTIGRLIGKAAKAAMDPKEFYAADKEALASMRSDGLINAAQEALPMTLMNKEQAAERKKRRDEILQMKADAGSRAAARIISRNTSPQEQFERGKKALASLGAKSFEDIQATARDTAMKNRMGKIDAAKKQIRNADEKDQPALIKAFEKMVDGMESTWGADTGAGSFRAEYDQFMKDRIAAEKLAADAKADLDAQELDNIKKLKAEAKKLFQGDNGKEAFGRARKELGHDPKSVADWKRMTKLMGSEGKKIASEQEAKADRVKSKKESLEERKRRFALSLMTPEKRRDATQKNLDDLKGKHAKETDPEKKIDLAGKIQAEMENLQGIQNAIAKKGQKGRSSIGLGDIFTRIHGQGSGKKDPQEEQVVILKDVKKVLDKIEGKGGMNP